MESGLRTWPRGRKESGNDSVRYFELLDFELSENGERDAPLLEAADQTIRLNVQRPRFRFKGLSVAGTFPG